MQLDRWALIEQDGHRYVEMEFAPHGWDPERETGDSAPFLRFRVDIGREGYPPLPEAQREALQHVRAVIAGEIRRLEAEIDAKR